MDHSSARTGVPAKSLLAALLVVLLVVVLVWGVTRPHRPLAREEAGKKAYHQVELYCFRHKLDVSLFGTPEVIRGRVACYDVEKGKDAYVPTWDFYYTYKGEPGITVLISYDEMRGVTELVHVFQPGEKWPYLN